MGAVLKRHDETKYTNPVFVGRLAYYVNWMEI